MSNFMKLRSSLRSLSPVIKSPVRKKMRTAKGKPKIEIKDEVEIDVPASVENEIKTEVKTEVVVKKEVETDNLSEKKWFPENFHQIYDNIKMMRTWVKAPVDNMEGNLEEKEDGPEERFLTLFSLMISSRTRDTLNIDVMKKMKKKGLNIQYVLDTPEAQLAEDIRPVNFYKTKAKNIKKSAQMLVDKFGGDVPKTIKELCELPGVGPKMGYLCLQAAWNLTVGIGVDTHVHRLANLFNWVSKPTKEPEDTRKELESWLPIELWEELNTNLVGFGQTICNVYKPKCEECLNNKICPGAFTHKVRKSPKKGQKKSSRD